VLTNKKGEPLPPERQPQMGTATSAATEAAAPIDDRPIAGGGMTAAAQTVAANREARWETRTGFRDAGKIVVAEGVVVTGNINGKAGHLRTTRRPASAMAGPGTCGRAGHGRAQGLHVEHWCGPEGVRPQVGKGAWTVAEARTRTAWTSCCTTGACSSSTNTASCACTRRPAGRRNGNTSIRQVDT